MPTALFLSPHLDDVAFSCGGTVARLARAGWHCVVATAFTRSVPDPAGFALKCQTDKGLPPEVDYMAVRRAEDAEAMQILGAEARWLNLAEAPHRGYESAAELFTGVKPGDEVAGELAEVLQDLFDDWMPNALFVPQGLGGHADHLQLIAAVRQRLDGPLMAEITWYRDTPYAIRNPAATPAPGVPGGPLFAVQIGETLAVKLDACAAYRTQLGFQFGGEAAMRTSLTRFAAGGEQFLGEPETSIPGFSLSNRVDLSQ